MQHNKIKKCGSCRDQDSIGIAQNSVKIRTSTVIKATINSSRQIC